MEPECFKTTVLGVGPYCVEFDDGEIITTRSEGRQKQIALASTLQAALDAEREKVRDLEAQVTRLEDEYAEKCVTKDNYITTLIEAKNKAQAKLTAAQEQLRLANCDQANTEADLNDVTAQLAQVTQERDEAVEQANYLRADTEAWAESFLRFVKESDVGTRPFAPEVERRLEVLRRSWEDYGISCNWVIQRLHTRLNTLRNLVRALPYADEDRIPHGFGPLLEYRATMDEGQSPPPSIEPT